MKTKYNFEYKVQRNAILGFIFTEFSITACYVIGDIIDKEKHSYIFEAVDTISNTQTRTMVQAIGFLYLKRARDPLHGIHKLDYMKLLCKIQKQSSDYLIKLIKKNESQDLNEED